MEAEYGSWRSPVTSEHVVSGSIRLNMIRTDQSGVYWLEMRPQEGGRQVIVRADPDGRTEDVVPEETNVRTRVHEYGGGDFWISQGELIFSEFDDQRLYYKSSGQGTPKAITSVDLPGTQRRYADGIIDHGRSRVICVREEHRENSEPQNCIIALDLDTEEEQVLISGGDFYSSPKISPDGNCLVWLTWNHPNMPWDGCELWMGTFDDTGMIKSKKCIAGGERESIIQPEWGNNSEVFFLSDLNNWWNLYCYREGVIKILFSSEADFGRPQWVFGMSSYQPVSDTMLVCSYVVSGHWKLALLDFSGEPELIPIDVPYSDIWSVRGDSDAIYFCGSSPEHASSIIRILLAPMVEKQILEYQVLRCSSDVQIEPGYLSRPEAISFPTQHNRKAYALFYPPVNADFKAPADKLPPLIVICHGGPTGSASTKQNLQIQYWTSRGIAVLDVDYGGSSGYGRQYRERLNGMWGVVDVEDCVNGARHLVNSGLVDSEQLAIRGGSAGGFTVLSALTFYDLFCAGASYYGVSDLMALSRHTHKFESKYLDNLIGPLPEAEKSYRERSPINYTSQLSCPVILFQGLKDKVVPPAQSEKMVTAMKKRGVPVCYLSFEEETHGFRKSLNIKKALESEIVFYSEIFGFTLAEKLEPVRFE